MTYAAFASNGAWDLLSGFHDLQRLLATEGQPIVQPPRQTLMCLWANHNTWNYVPSSFRSVFGFFCGLSQFYLGRRKRRRQQLNVTAHWRTELNWARRWAHSQHDRTNYFNSLVIALVHMGLEPVTSRSAVRCSTNRDNRAAIAPWVKVWRYIVRPMKKYHTLDLC